MISPEKRLESVGLSSNQAAIYFYLLQHPESSITDISKKTDIKRSTTYLVIDELQHLGLINALPEGKRTVYSAASFSRYVASLGHQLSQAEHLQAEFLTLQEQKDKQQESKTISLPYNPRYISEFASSLAEGEPASLWLLQAEEHVSPETLATVAPQAETIISADNQLRPLGLPVKSEILPPFSLYSGNNRALIVPRDTSLPVIVTSDTQIVASLNQLCETIQNLSLNLLSTDL